MFCLVLSFVTVRLTGLLKLLIYIQFFKSKINPYLRQVLNYRKEKGISKLEFLDQQNDFLAYRFK